MPPEENTNAQNQSGNGQTVDYQVEYTKLMAQIASGEYVPKKVYTGLQQTHEQTIISAKADKDALASLNAEKAQLTTSLAGLQTTLAEATTKATTNEQTAAQLRNQVERNKLIMKDFPQLASFEAEGLLPQATLQDLPAILSVFSEKMGAIKTDSKKDTVAGSSAAPASKSADVAPTAQQLLDKANELARAGKFAEYNIALNEYYTATKAK